MPDKIKLSEAVIVEGKYDKIKLSSFLDALIVTTEGFGLFKDSEKRGYIRKLADERGIIIMTDSDSAGFMIRSCLKSFIPGDKIKNVYVPQINGKEKRKSAPSREGTLGVEGLSREVILEALRHSRVISENASLPDSDSADKVNMIYAADAADTAQADDFNSAGPAAGNEQLSSGPHEYTAAELYSLGLAGTPSSAERRRELLKLLGLPSNINTKSLIKYMNTADEAFVAEAVNRLKNG